MDIEKTIKNLKARHFSVQHFSSGEEACTYLLGEIKNTSVGIGGSKTVDQLGGFISLSCYFFNIIIGAHACNACRYNVLYAFIGNRSLEIKIICTF